MAYSDDVVNATLNNYLKSGRNERILLSYGDPVAGKLWDMMEGQSQNSVKDHGRRFQFDVTYAASVATTQGGLGGDLNIGQNESTLKVGNDARAVTHALFAVEEHNLTALNTPEQLGDYLQTTFTANGIQLQDWWREVFFCGAAASTDPNLGFAQLCTINGGDATPVTYTAADGTSRNGIINFQSEAAQVAAGITRHGISAADVSKWVSRYVDNTGGSWAADSQTLNAEELFMLCTEGAGVFSGNGADVMRAEPDIGICTYRGYAKWKQSLRAQVRYALGEDAKEVQARGMNPKLGGGLLFGESTPIYYCRTIDAAVSAGTAYVGYGGVLIFLNSKSWGIRYVNSNGANPGSQRQRGRVWKFKLMPEEAVKDRRVFKGSSEQQVYCRRLGANGGMKGWDQA